MIKDLYSKPTTTKTIKIFDTTITITKPIKRKRIGANKQNRIDNRKKSIQEFFNRPIVQIIGYAITSFIVLGGAWLLFSLAVILDPSNPYYN